MAIENIFIRKVYIYMRQIKKLTRTQRMLLTRLGYQRDLHVTYYVKENENAVFFVYKTDDEQISIIYDKKLNTLQEHNNIKL